MKMSLRLLSVFKQKRAARLLLAALAIATVNVAEAHDHESVLPSAQPGISFIENKGQWTTEARFKAELPGGALFLTPNGFVYNYQDQKDLDRIHNLLCGPNVAEGTDVTNEVIHGHAYKVNFVGSNPNSTFTSNRKQSFYHNYFIGQDQSKWASRVGVYQEVVQANVYNGVDLKIYGSDKGHNLKYDFIIAPNADPNQIRLSFDGVKPALNAKGDLVIKTSVNEIVEKAPVTYQLLNDKKVAVTSKYVLKNGVLSFAFPNGYDQSLPLIIDPDLIFATYSGSTASAQYAHATTYDNLGSTYAAGMSSGAGWPTTTGAYQTTQAGTGYSAGIIKYSANGTQALFATYFGGPGAGNPIATVMRANTQNQLYMSGIVSNLQMPVTTNAFQTTMSGSSDIYIAKFSEDGTTLLASTYVGGSGIEAAFIGTTTVYTGSSSQQANPINLANIAFDNQDNVWITSNSGSTNFPITANAYQSTMAGSHDAVVFKMNPNLTSMLYGTYLGGSGWDGGLGIEFNDNNNTIGVVGYTSSTNFPTTAGAYHTTNQGGTDGFALVLNNLSYQLAAATYIGTSSTDIATRLAFDCGNNLFVAGRTQGNYPVTNTAAEGMVPTGLIFVDKLNETLSGSVASTRTGGTNTSIIPSAMMVDLCGNILVATLVNNTTQPGMPLTTDAFETAPRAFYFAAFEPNFTGLAFGSYFGSGGSDHHHPGVSRIDPKGLIYQSVCYVGANGGWNTYPPNVHAPNKLNGTTNDVVTFKFDFEVVGLDAESESGYAGYGAIPHAVRGCKSAFINYTRNGDTTIPMVLRFNIIPPSGTIATNGVDYQYIYDSLYFAPFERHKSLEIKPLLVPNMPTGPKMVVIESLNPCGCDGGMTDVIRRDTVFILDSIRAGISTPLPAYCPGTQITITGDVDPGLEFNWHPAEFNNNSLVITPTLLTTRDYTITATQPGAPATCPPVKKVFHAYVEQYPVIHLPSDTTVCLNAIDSVAIPVTVSPDSVNYRFNWSPATGLRAANLQTNYFKMPPGVYNYAITATTPLANCSTTKNLTINVRPPFQLTNILPQSGTVVNYQEEVDMSAQGAVIYTWLPVHKFYDPTLQYATTMPIEEPGTYYVTGIDQYGCRDTVPVALEVRYPYDPIIPNAFSPNGDGKNDFFLIPNGKFQKLHRFEIYNRWGKRVFHTNDPVKGWDGTDIDNGKPCDQSVYNYVISVQLPNGEQKTYKGDVTLIR
ncbi:MAG: T9SS type B sorting domain-containing protein [Sphingobacteriales bacterium]|nr:MAG: T9SS type B sorting domain-containing protein [Sphingobacteriales bacterium]